MHYNCTSTSSSRVMRITRYADRATTPHHSFNGVQFALRSSAYWMRTSHPTRPSGHSVTGFSSRAEREMGTARSWLRCPSVESSARGWCETDSGTGTLHGSNRISSLALVRDAIPGSILPGSRPARPPATPESFCVR
jgi:hypothetical protein